MISQIRILQIRILQIRILQIRILQIRILQFDSAIGFCGRLLHACIDYRNSNEKQRRIKYIYNKNRSDRHQTVLFYYIYIWFLSFLFSCCSCLISAIRSIICIDRSCFLFDPSHPVSSSHFMIIFHHSPLTNLYVQIIKCQKISSNLKNINQMAIKCQSNVNQKS